MKKLSFFLMAMLFSVMSFAQDAIYTLDGTITGGSNGYADASSLTQDNIAWSVTGNTTMSPWRIGGKSLTNQDRAVYSKNPLAYNIDKIELTHGTASSITVNSLKLIISDAANGAGETIDVAFKASATTTIDLPEGDYSNKYFKFLYNVTVSGTSNKYVQFESAKFYAALAEDAVKAPVIKGAEDFISETEIAIEAEDDVTVYYTVDGTEPTTASTVYTAPFTVKETTTVKAVAYRGEKASFVTSATFTKATQVTCAEAAEAAMKVASNNATTNITYVVYGYVTELDGDLSSGQQKFWVSDTKGGENTFYSYYCNVPRALVVGDYIQMFGKLTKYNTTPQMKNGDVTIAEEPIIEEPTIECKDAIDFGAVVYTDEVEGQTLEVTGYNLTSDITVTLSDDVFAVDQTTLPAEGGELVVTPVSPLAAGTHTATLTLTSGEATAEVTLTIVAKDVYTITWSVNGETTTTTVVEGDKLALPAAPEAPEACSEKVFVGWTAAEEVNEDGSDIEWVTAATAPTAAATYYAVFAAQEGEGGAIETSVSVNIGEYASANSWTNQTQYLSMSIDENITATITEEGEHHNSGKYYENGTNWRIYQNESPTLTIAAAEGVTISTVAVTYAIQNTGILTLDGVNIESEAICNINASSVTFGVGNTGSAANGQVRVTKINVTYFAGAAATYTDYSTTCEAEPEGIEVVLENAYKEVYLMWNRANFFGEHATYGEISVQINNYNGYGTYAEGVSSRIAGVKVNGSATFENKGETDLLTATLSDAEGTVYVVKAEVPTPKTYEVVATNAAYVNVDQGWSVVLTVNGLTVGEEELTLTVYWDGVGGSEEGYEATAGFEGSLQGMILVDKGEDDVLSFEGTLKDASDNSYIFDFEATPKVAETYTLTFEDMVIEPGQWDDNLYITAENTEYAIEFQLFGGKTKGYGEYGFTDDYPDVDEIYINFEYATMAEGTVANYYLNEETSLATIELTVVLGIDIYNITLTGQPLVNPEDILPTDTINITMTQATIGLYGGMPKVAASSEEAELSIVLVGENPYKATVEDFSASSYLVTAAGELTFLRGGLEIVEVGDVKIAYIGVLCSDHKWYNITLTTGKELTTGLENLDTTIAPAKAIVNGQLVIIKNGVQYNATGAVVK